MDSFKVGTSTALMGYHAVGKLSSLDMFLVECRGESLECMGAACKNDMPWTVLESLSWSICSATHVPRIHLCYCHGWYHGYFFIGCWEVSEFNCGLGGCTLLVIYRYVLNIKQSAWIFSFSYNILNMRNVLNLLLKQIEFNLLVIKFWTKIKIITL